MSNLLTESERGHQAKMILDSQLWQEAVSHIDTSLLKKMKEHHSDPIACQEIALTKVIVDQFNQFFQTIRDTGRLADIQLKAEIHVERQ